MKNEISLQKETNLVKENINIYKYYNFVNTSKIIIS